jgi:hypothetical protein
LAALRTVLQSGNSSAMAASDHINIAVGIPINDHRIIVPTFVITHDREAVPPDAQGLFRRNVSSASAVALNDTARPVPSPATLR